jgi:hypothetical protein
LDLQDRKVLKGSVDSPAKWVRQEQQARTVHRVNEDLKAIVVTEELLV